MTADAFKRAVRSVRELPVLEPPRPDHRRSDDRPPTAALQFMTESALLIDDLLGVEPRALAELRRRPVRENAPDLVRRLAGDVLVA